MWGTSNGLTLCGEIERLNGLRHDAESGAVEWMRKHDELKDEVERLRAEKAKLKHESCAVCGAKLNTALSFCSKCAPAALRELNSVLKKEIPCAGNQPG